MATKQAAKEPAAADTTKDATAQTEGSEGGKEGEGDSAYDGAEMVRKLSPKSVCGNVKKFFPDHKPGEQWPPTSLYIVIGQAHGLKEGTGDNGPWVAFLGAFEAIRTKDGKTFQSGQCFVPKAVEDLLAASLKQAQKNATQNGGIASVEFAIEVGVKWSEMAIGYEYTIKNLVKTANADPLQLLRQRLHTAVPALALKTVS